MYLQTTMSFSQKLEQFSLYSQRTLYIYTIVQYIILRKIFRMSRRRRTFQTSRNFEQIHADNQNVQNFNTGYRNWLGFRIIIILIRFS